MQRDAMCDAAVFLNGGNFVLSQSRLVLNKEAEKEMIEKVPECSQSPDNLEAVKANWESLLLHWSGLKKSDQRARRLSVYFFLSFLSCLEEFRVCLPGVYQLIQLTVSCCHFPFVLTCHPFVFRFTLAADCRITRCYLSGDNAVTCICFQTTNHLVIQVSGKKTKVFVCSWCGMCYIYISTGQLPSLAKPCCLS